MASGGAAVNAGADFQQRIAAFLMVNMLSDISCVPAFGIGNGVEVREIRFESDDEIDDLVLITSNGRRFIQAKRALSLSDKVDSDFSSVLKQFVRQFCRDQSNDDEYILATSSRSSQKITKELRKLTYASRLNEEGADDNTLTVVENEVLTKTRSVCESHYLDAHGTTLTEEIFKRIFSKIHVAIIDVEEGQPLEHAAITLLSGKTNINARLVWDGLVAICLSLAKDRLSIDRGGLEKRIGHYLSDEEQPGEEQIEHVLRAQMAGSISAGREVLMVENPEDGPDYLIMELIRFEDDGARRLKFFKNRVELLNGMSFKVVKRTSTYAGMERFLESSTEKYEDAEIVILAANIDEDLESKPFVKAYAEQRERMLEESNHLLKCIHCGEAISENQSPLIEIDQDDLDPDVGLIHSGCCRPNDRILGVIQSDLFEEHKHLKNFDYNLWFERSCRGPSLFAALAKMQFGLSPIAWKPDYEQFTRGAWCVQMNLEDGSARYVHERGRVVRYSEEKASEVAELFNTRFADGLLADDPWCYTSQDEGFVTYSVAMEHLGAEVALIKCLSAERVRYTKAIGEAYSKVENFYAPVIYLVDDATGSPMLIGDAHFLITDPLTIGRYVENWRKSGYEVGSFSVAIVENDDSFDRLVRNALARDEQVVVNPIFRPDGTLARGAPIANFYELLGSMSEQNDP